MLASSFGSGWKIDVMDATALQKQIKAVVASQTLLHKEATAKVQQQCE